jgi:hypothetical protein
VRERLLGPVDESDALDRLRDLNINYDPARAPEDGQAEGHWHVDSGATLIGDEAPGPPEHGGAWEIACRLVSQYEFADGRILRAIYRSGHELLGRNMLLEARFCGLRFYLGVRVEQCLRPVDRPGRVYLPGDQVESQAMTGVGASAGKVTPDAHRSPWRRLWPRGWEGRLAVADR